jgi:hypothetical protein
MLHENGFDFVAVGQTKEPLDRLFVRGMLHRYRLDAIEREALGRKGRAQFFGQHRYLFEIVDQLFGGCAIQLLQAVILQPVRGRKCSGISVAGTARLFVDPNILGGPLCHNDLF